MKCRSCVSSVNERMFLSLGQNLLKKRLIRKAGVDLFLNMPLIEIAYSADYVRRQKNPNPIVTYLLDRNINYTNACCSGCEFCAFYTDPGSDKSYILSDKELFEKIEATIEAGGTQILMQGGLNPELGLEYYEILFKKIKARYKIHIHALSPPEIVHITRSAGSSYEYVIKKLMDSGLDSIPGGGAEILVDRVRKKLSPNKCSSSEWIEVMRTAHKSGIKTTATMMFGHIETIEERIEHFEKIRSLQDETGGFTAFIPWTFQPGNSRLDKEKTSSIDYLRTLALSRLYIDNIPHIQVSWVTQGFKIAGVALSYGADDFGSLMMEENVVKAAGTSFRMSEEEIVRSIESMNFIPRRRDMYYNILGEPLCRRR